MENGFMFSQTQKERLSFSLLPLWQSYGFLETWKENQDMCNYDTAADVKSG